MKHLITIIILACTVCLVTKAGGGDAKYRYYYIEAVRQMDMKNHALAYELLKRCKEMKPEAAETDYTMGKLLAMYNKDSLAIAHLRQAALQDTNNVEYTQMLARVYLMNNELDSAAEAYEHLSRLQPQRSEHLEMLSNIYEHTNRYAEQLATLNRLELLEGGSENITLSKMQVYSFLGDSTGARRELKSLIDAHPYDIAPRLMMGNWLLSYGNKQEALETFLAALKEEPTNAAAQISLMDYYRADGQMERADSMLLSIFVNPNANPQTTLGMVRDWIVDNARRGGDSLQVMQMFDKILSLPQKTSDVAELKVFFLKYKKAPVDSIKKGWEYVLSITPEHLQARQELIALKWGTDSMSSVIEECRKAIDYIPGEPILYLNLGEALYRDKQFSEAITVIKKGIGLSNSNTNRQLLAGMHCILGDVLYQNGNQKEAFLSYDSCLVYDPNNVVCLNNYAYFLSLEGGDIKKAEKMGYRAITAEASNGTYLDTYAWILYKQNRYEEARIYIDLALKYLTEKADSTDTTLVENIPSDILDHAGDIYLKLNQHALAVDYWQKALKMEDVENEALIRKKIKKAQKVLKKME